MTDFTKTLWIGISLGMLTMGGASLVGHGHPIGWCGIALALVIGGLCTALTQQDD